MNIKPITGDEVQAAAQLAGELWPESAPEELVRDFDQLWRLEDHAIFLARTQEGEAAGFALVALRRDYVEGADTSPVGYLEGIYVRPAYRHSGLGRALLKKGEAWARRHGCTEFGSDVEWHNGDSRHFHERCGFREANRVICYIKPL